METLQFPLYFLDYESFNPALPRFSGYKPYQQIPFQFSLHRLDTPDGELINEKFLYTKEKDPSPFFIDALKKVIGNTGSIIVWYKPFESSHINKNLAIRMSECADLIENMNARMFDLMTIFSKQLHIHPDFHGSASIKKVLPVLIKELSYEKLDIQEGNTASRTWSETVLEGKNVEKKDKIMQNLLEYCCLDTLAMVKIFQKLNCYNIIHESRHCL